MGVTGTNRNQRASRIVLLNTRLAAPIESPTRCFQVHLFLEKSLSLSFSLSDCISIHPSISTYHHHHHLSIIYYREIQPQTEKEYNKPSNTHFLASIRMTLWSLPPFP